MMKPRPGARSDSTPKKAANRVESATAKIAAVSWSYPAVMARMQA